MSGLEQQYPGIKAENVDATTDQAAAECQDLGFHNHGIVIRSDSGDVLWKQPDHEVNVTDLVAELEKITGA